MQKQVWCCLSNPTWNLLDQLFPQFGSSVDPTPHDVFWAFVVLSAAGAYILHQGIIPWQLAVCTAKLWCLLCHKYPKKIGNPTIAFPMLYHHQTQLYTYCKVGVSTISTIALRFSNPSCIDIMTYVMIHIWLLLIPNANVSLSTHISKSHVSTLLFR